MMRSPNLDYVSRTREAHKAQAQTATGMSSIQTSLDSRVLPGTDPTHKSTKSGGL